MLDLWSSVGDARISRGPRRMFPGGLAFDLRKHGKVERRCNGTASSFRYYRMHPVMPARDDSTSVTLLGRLVSSPPDQKAWNEFVERYGPRIFQWCRAWGLQEADVLDVSQAVLAKLSVQLRRFDYDPSRSFRGWLRALAQRRARCAGCSRPCSWQLHARDSGTAGKLGSA